MVAVVSHYIHSPRRLLQITKEVATTVTLRSVQSGDVNDPFTAIASIAAVHELNRVSLGLLTISQATYDTSKLKMWN